MSNPPMKRRQPTPYTSSHSSTFLGKLQIKKNANPKPTNFIFNYSKSHSQFICPYIDKKEVSFEFSKPQSVTFKLFKKSQDNILIEKSDNEHRADLNKILNNYIMATNKINIKSKKIRKYKTKKEIFADKKKIITAAMALKEKGYKVKYISQLLQIKPSLINNMWAKKREGKIPNLEGRKRPTKIKKQYIDYLVDYFKSGQIIFSVNDTHNLLSTPFPELKKVSYSTIRKIIKKSGLN